MIKFVQRSCAVFNNAYQSIVAHWYAICFTLGSMAGQGLKCWQGRVFIYKFKWELTLHSDIVLFLEQLISLRFIMVFIVIMVVMIGVPCRHTINNIVNGDYWPEGWKSPIIFEGKILWDISLTALSYFKELIDTWKKDSRFYFFLFGISLW